LERQEILKVLHSERFVDLAPAEVWATLLDEGVYLGSQSTFYRLLRAASGTGERRRQATHPALVKPELVACRPNEVYSCYADVVVMPTLRLDARCGAVSGAEGSA
jgi:putative transposase